MRIIPKKNYIILLLVVVVTVLGTFYTRNKYLAKVAYENSSNERMTFVSEIKEKELDNYLMENRDVVIYMASSSDETVFKFEKELRNYVNDEQLGKDVIYINLNNVSKKFISKFEDKYFSNELKASKTHLNDEPNMLIVSGGKVTSIMDKKDNKINIEDAKEYLSKYVKEEL